MTLTELADILAKHNGPIGQGAQVCRDAQAHIAELESQTLTGVQSQMLQLWKQPEFTELHEIVTRLAVIQGDLAREARYHLENGSVPQKTCIPREMGNLVLSSLRWIDDLGFDLNDCISAAMDAQAKYVEVLRDNNDTR